MLNRIIRYSFQKIFRLGYVFMLLLPLTWSCSSGEKNEVAVDQDFCAQIHFDEPNPLSAQLEPFLGLMDDKTAVYVLEEGDGSMIARAWLCESAEESIDIQYFIFSADNVGLIAIDYLIRAADRGVKVRLLVDDIMVSADAGELLALDAHPNIFIKIYNPTANIGKTLPEKLLSAATNFQEFNQRMHNKTFIVDGTVVITGGRNIADEYFDYDHEYNFRDRDVLLFGAVSSDINNSFELFWNNSLSTAISDLAEPQESHELVESNYEYLHEYACDPANFWPQVRERIKLVPIAFKEICESNELVWVDRVSFVSDIPGKNSGDQGLRGGGICTDSLVALINRAQKYILIQSPYLITTENGQELFKRAIDRGVEVKILTNSLSSTDNIEAFSGYERDRETLLKLGIDLYEFKPDAEIRRELMTGSLQQEIDFLPIFGLHAKSMVVDGETAVIGTFNLDPRSANLNTECVAIIYDHKIATDLTTAIENDMRPENAWQISTGNNPDGEAGYGKRIRLFFDRIVPKSVL